MTIIMFQETKEKVEGKFCGHKGSGGINHLKNTAQLKDKYLLVPRLWVMIRKNV